MYAEVALIIKRLKFNKVPGIDGISAFTIKEVKDI